MRASQCLWLLGAMACSKGEGEPGAEPPLADPPIESPPSPGPDEGPVEVEPDDGMDERCYTVGEAPPWGVETDHVPDFCAAEDVPETQVELVRRDHATASAAWGNFGPVEYWIVGTELSAATALEEVFCTARRDKDPSLPPEFDEYCAERDYNFEDYARDGGAGLNTRRSEYESYSVFLVTLASKYPFPDESDYTVVTYHEYFHVVQNAHIDSRDETEREDRMVVNPWWSEGGAEYMAQLLYSRQPGVAEDYLRERMRWKMESKSMLEEGERFSDIPYGERARIAYDLGTWFVAFLVDRVGEDAYVIDFYDDLNEMGFEEAFTANFGGSSVELLDAFEAFLELDIEDQLSIIP